ncbi:MAG: hypothetical protein CM1200mP16_06280 [Nitrospina sp.]|nr:MAG: hypothetical protein CM1200mP16_06280 [Nitrospina sp.]
MSKWCSQSGCRYRDFSDSYQAALLSAGAGLEALGKILEGTVGNAFCAVRPPGHHAEQNKAMGFCLFNNVGVIARYAQDVKNIQKIFIFDWDVHHGNGTQHSFYKDSSSITAVSINIHFILEQEGLRNWNGRWSGVKSKFTNASIFCDPIT